MIGQLLVTQFNGLRTTGMITETEAYHQNEKACHAYNGRFTKRTSILFEPGGLSYIYLCYGIHSLFNVTTGKQGEAAAVLIRAFEPVHGIEKMMERRGISKLDPGISSGPGKLTQALGINLSSNGDSLTSSQQIWIEQFRPVPECEVIACPRIGVDYAGKDALLPWRFHLKKSQWISRN